MANVFQGQIVVEPTRAEYLIDPSVPNVPDPINTWEFMNTCLP